MKKYIITAIVTILLTYIAFAFVKADFNAFNWGEDIRFAFVYISVLFCIGSVAVSVLSDKF